MTHEELLAKIDEGGARAFQVDSYGWIALRAVVELHSPCTGSKHDDAIELANVPCICVSCDDYEYPCPTIQAIEKELM